MTQKSERMSEKRKELFLALGCMVCAVFLWGAQIRAEQWELAGRIAPGILRFHVIADSNSKEDQEIKLEVKSFLLERISEGMETAGDGDGMEGDEKDRLVSYLSAHKNKLEREAGELVRRLGGNGQVSMKLGKCEFPEKYYGDLRLPAGIYEALQVRIGKGMGHNWWCILYPKVCITKDALAVVPESSREELKRILSPEDFLALQAERPEIQVDFRFYRMLANTLFGK